jgi:hypothetical protein
VKLVGKAAGKKPPGRPMHGWEDNIKTDLAEIVCEGMDWIQVTDDNAQ